MNIAGARRQVLVLGGTTEARELAAALDRLVQPRLPAGDVRIGGFGGPAGLTSWLAEHDIVAVVDATHPFAEQISASATAACADAGIPFLRLERPGWTERAGDRWFWTDDLAAAAELAPRLGHRILLTIGRQRLAEFAAARSAWFLIRCVDPPEPPLPPNHALVLDRGPFTLAGELALIATHAIDLIVTRDSGGAPTEAKLEAARRSQLPVIVIRRRPRLVLTNVADVAGAFKWVRSVVDTG